MTRNQDLGVTRLLVYYFIWCGSARPGSQLAANTNVYLINRNRVWVF